MHEIISSPDNAKEMLNAIGSRFGAMAKGKEVRWADEKNFAMQAIRSNPRLLECTKESLQIAVFNIANTGLSLNPVSAYAYMVPRNIRVGTDSKGKPIYEKHAVTMPGYRGLIKLGNDSGHVDGISVGVIREGDTYEYELGTTPKLRHVIPLGKTEHQRGKRIAAYCVTHLKSGQKLVTILTPDDIARIKKASDNSDKSYSPWTAHEDEMWCKSAIRRAYKTWPKAMATEAMTSAIQIMDKYDGMSKSEEPAPASELCISQEQVDILTTVVADFELPIEKCLNTLASAYGVSHVEDLPARVFDQAKERLVAFCEKQKVKA